MDHQVTAVISAPLSEELGITFAKSPDGWRFHGWHRSEIGARPLPPPPAVDCQLYFQSADEAVSYFQARYGAPPARGRTTTR